MIQVGHTEIDAMTEVIQSGRMFRYGIGGACLNFEKRYAGFIGTSHVALCSSGTAALTAALAGLSIGPGDEVLVPAHTYMATALAVLAVGAIPVIVDIDDSITIDPQALKETIGPQTRAVIPVHMWGALCDMDAIMKIAAESGLKVVEDACQCVCGFYKGKGAGSLGDAGAFSFNYFKNMTAGEGGAMVTDNETVYQRARCMIDPCSFYWEGREIAFQPFSNCGTRANEFQGAMLNAQLDRIPPLISKMRQTKQTIIEGISGLGFSMTPRHDPDGECATALMIQLPSAEEADRFCAKAGGTVLAKTGRHNYTEWDPVLNQQGAHHPLLNPYKHPANDACRKIISKDMLPRSLDILSRTVSIGINPDTDAETCIGRIRSAC